MNRNERLIMNIIVKILGLKFLMNILDAECNVYVEQYMCSEINLEILKR